MSIPKSKLKESMFDNVKTFVKKLRTKEHGNGTMTVKVRWNDECRNGHNSFSITADFMKGNRHEFGGCCPDEIVKYFPELKHLIKWHLVSSDEPMHYIANTTYHARDREHGSLDIGAPTHFNTKLKFKGAPFTFKEQTKGFWQYLDSVGDFNSIEVEPVPYDGKDDYAYADNYSLTGFIKENANKKWYKTPFNGKEEAQEFLQALQENAYSFVKTPYAWNKACEPNLEYARSSAIWPEATLEQLRDEKALKKRLPALMLEFKKVIESLGFVY